MSKSAGMCYLMSHFVLLLSILTTTTTVNGDPQVPCYFIFGDSLVDNGNNNNMASLAKANYAPYGIDFPNGATGRFSNGLTTVDAISQLLGFDDFIPPYVNARGNQLLTGVNFASAAAGIREETGRQLGGRISFGGQVRNYISTVQQIVNILGDEDTASDHLSKCLFTVGMGSNDYLNNYFMPNLYSSSRQYTPQQYADLLINQYSQQIRTLYNYGARKVAIIGVGQVGCSPSELAQSSGDGVTCVDKINVACDMFNQRVIRMVDQFNQLNGAHFTYINAYGIFQDILRNPAANGLSVTNRGCCGVGRNNGQITCLPFQTPCRNRDQYLFWDAFHPTEVANVLIGKRSYSSIMVSKTLLIFCLLLATALLVYSDTATGEKKADEQSEVVSKDHYGGGGGGYQGGGGGYQGGGGGYQGGGGGYQGGGGGYQGGGGGYNHGGGGGGYQGGGGGYHHGGGGGGYNHGGGGGGYHHGGGGGGSSCYNGCCGHGFHGGCRCCKTPDEVPDLSYLKPHMP